MVLAQSEQTRWLRKIDCEWLGNQRPAALEELNRQALRRTGQQQHPQGSLLLLELWWLQQ